MERKSEEREPPFKVCQDNTLGRHLVASRSIRAGEVIIQETPLVRGPFQHTIPVCLSCGKSLNAFNNKPCDKCGWPVCNNDECEKSMQHLPECTFTVDRGNKINIKNFGIIHPNYRCITILRCLYHKKNNPEVWERLMQLESHHQFLDSQQHQIADFVRNFFSLQESFTQEEILKVCGILKTNGVEVPLTQPPYLAIYDTCSMFEHNCKANCSKTFTNEGEVLITSSEDINEGDHLSICYTDPLWGTLNRRLHLYETKHFWCNCARCKDPTEFDTNISALRCPTRDCEGLLLPQSFMEAKQIWICSQCERKLSDDEIRTVLEDIGQNLADLPKGVVPSIMTFINDFGEVLPPSHYYMLDIKVALMQLLGSQVISNLSHSYLSILVKTAECLEQVVRKIAPAEKRLLGIIKFQLAVGWVEIARRRQDRDNLLKEMERSQDALIECCDLLENEPSSLQESKIYRKAKLELKESSRLLTQSTSCKVKSL